MFAELDLQPETELGSDEAYWRDHEPWLREQGFELRARFRPGWVPSWVADPKKKGYREEDGISNTSPGLDVTRVSDGKILYLKRVDGQEAVTEPEIMRFLHSGTFKDDSKNHCSPLIDVLTTTDDPPETLLVLPYLLPYDTPPFASVGEWVEFLRQVFEGLQFMHHHRVAHCDCKFDNIMTDSLPLFNTRPHPGTPTLDFTMDMKSKVKFTTRTRHPVKYLFIDFGLSRRFSEGEEPLVPSGTGGTRAPEFQSKQPCNAYALDVYCLGNFIRTEFTHGDEDEPPVRGTEFMRPLVESMCAEDPTKRPTIDEVVSRFNKVRGSLSSAKLRSRLVCGKGGYPNYPSFFSHYTRTIGDIFIRRRSMPTPP
ncbi:kinase-like domain-containing protein [Flagelloscypha sp. PMI_526]|nr:kinase-like domain-containing protein [Flagelloscypha sp. PMI_526]